MNELASNGLIKNISFIRSSRNGCDNQIVIQQAIFQRFEEFIKKERL